MFHTPRCTAVPVVCGGHHHTFALHAVFGIGHGILGNTLTMHQQTLTIYTIDRQWHWGQHHFQVNPKHIIYCGSVWDILESDTRSQAVLIGSVIEQIQQLGEATVLSWLSFCSFTQRIYSFQLAPPSMHNKSEHLYGQYQRSMKCNPMCRDLHFVR